MEATGWGLFLSFLRVYWELLEPELSPRKQIRV